MRNWVTVRSSIFSKKYTIKFSTTSDNVFKRLLRWRAEAYLDPSQTSKMQLFCENTYEWVLNTPLEGFVQNALERNQRLLLLL